ncbi:MAG: Serine/threonine-protein kinase PknD [Phycisphaerae bacterium]|nr:Serine/threonine-protein kinase PknD [Phycisphaerae bacterium]
MDTNRESKAAEIFRRALDLAGEVERAAYLREVCREDAELLRAVQSLLSADAAAEGETRGAVGPVGGPATPEIAGGSNTLTAADGTTRETPGTLIGRYKLLERIGEGGFGSVWMAEQREPVKRRVALKVIKLGMDTRQVVARFEAERQALALMDHPNIAKVFDGGATDQGRPFFVMELVRGVPITEFCDHQRLDTRRRLELFAQVCNAVQHAHTKGIIHRDIKPSNVLVTLHDGVPVPKVIDFGIAKATNAELTEKTLFTEHRQMIGTPAYMSPEQAEMSGLDIDTRSDVYSLGVLLYELLAGAPPFEPKRLLSAGYAEMVRIIREEEPPKPSLRLSSLGQRLTTVARSRQVDAHRLGTLLRGEIDWIVMKCLEKDRTRRYETASGLRADVERYLSGEAVVAAPPTVVYRLRTFARRHRAALLVSAALLTTMLLGVIAVAWGMIRAWDSGRSRLVEHARGHLSRLAERLRNTDPNTRAIPIGSGPEGQIEGLGLFADYAITSLIESRDEMTAAYFKANAESRRAEWERGNAMAAQARAEDEADRLRRVLYAHRIATAQRAHRSGEYMRMGQELRECPADLRGWEWRYLARLADQSIATLVAPATHISWCADGRALFYWSEGTLGRWDTESGETSALVSVPHYNGALAVSPDGRWVALGRPAGEDTVIALLDVRSGQQFDLADHTLGDVRALAFSADGTRLVSATEGVFGRQVLEERWTPAGVVPHRGSNAGRAPPRLIVWHVAARARAVSIDGAAATEGVAFAARDRYVLAWRREPLPPHRIRIWDSMSGAPIEPPNDVCDSPLRQVAVDAEVPIATALYDDGTLVTWDVSTGAECAARRRVADARAVAVSGSRRRLAVVDRAGQLSIVDFEGPEAVVLHGHQHSASGVQFSPDGRRVATLALDGTVKLWTPQTPGAETTVYQIRTSMCGTSVTDRPLANCVLLCSSLLDDEGRECLDQIGDPARLSHVPESSLDAWQEPLVAWSTQTDWRPSRTEWSPRVNDLSPLGDWFATTDEDSIRIHRTLDGAIESLIPASFAQDPTWSRDQRRFAFWEAGCIWVGDAAAPGLRVPICDAPEMPHFALSPDGALIVAAAASADRSEPVVRCWSTSTGHPRGTLHLPSADLPGINPEQLCFSGDGRRIALAYSTTDGVRRICRLATWNGLSNVPLADWPTGATVDHLAVDGAGTRIATADTSASTVTLWDADFGLELLSFSVAPVQPHAVDFSADGETLLVRGAKP